MPTATSSPSISHEQRERIMRNRRLAEERRLARLKNNTSNKSTNSNTEIGISINLTFDDESVDKQNDAQDIRVKKNKKALVIDSDDDDISNGVHSCMEVDSNQNKHDNSANETSKIGNNTDDINFDSPNTIVAQNEATELIDITEGYEFRNKKTNDKINEVIDLVSTQVQDTRIIIGNNDVNSSDDECDLNSVSVSVAVDVEKGGSKNTDINEETSEISKHSCEDSHGKDVSENKNNLGEEVLNEIEKSKESINTIEENANIHKENVSNFNEKAGSEELDTIDKEHIGGNIAQSVELGDLMDVDFCDDF